MHECPRDAAGLHTWKYAEKPHDYGEKFDEHIITCVNCHHQRYVAVKKERHIQTRLYTGPDDIDHPHNWIVTCPMCSLNLRYYDESKRKIAMYLNRTRRVKLAGCQHHYIITRKL